MERAQMNAAEARLLRCAYAITCASLAFAGYFPINNPDTFGHLAQGRQIAELGRVPVYDSFSFFRDTPQLWRNYEWLSDALTWRVYAFGGPDALLAAKCLLLVLTGALLINLAQRLGGVRAAALCCVLIVVAIPASRFRLTERPHLLALPFCALYFTGYAYLLRGFGQARKAVDVAWIVTLALAHCAWVNLHGSHLLGLAITLVHCVIGFTMPSARLKLLAVLGLQLAASCISPYGPAILVDAIAHVANPVYRELVSEWEPWQPTDPPWLFLSPILHTLLLVVCVSPLFRAGVTTRALLFSTCVLGLASFRSIRFVAEYLLLGAPVIALGLERVLVRVTLPKLSAALAAVLAACSVLVPWGAVRLPPYLAPGHGESTQRLPVAAGHWLARHARSPRVLGAIEDSWYLMYAVPQAHFLVDGRVPFYGAEHLKYVRYAFEHPDALVSLLAKYRIDSVVVRHTFHAQRRLFDTLRARPDFVLVSIEDRYATFVRTDLALKENAPPRALPLEPSYDSTWLMNADAAREREIRAALAQLPDEENNRGYRGYVASMLALKPLMRPGYAAGLPSPTNATQIAVLRQAQTQLARASKGADGVPIVDAYHALVSIALCDFDAAESALALATREGESRETLLGAQELALRRGETTEVASFLERANAEPQAAGDTWLAALREELTETPRCP